MPCCVDTSLNIFALQRRYAAGNREDGGRAFPLNQVKPPSASCRKPAYMFNSGIVERGESIRCHDRGSKPSTEGVPDSPECSAFDCFFAWSRYRMPPVAATAAKVNAANVRCVFRGCGSCSTCCALLCLRFIVPTPFVQAVLCLCSFSG